MWIGFYFLFFSSPPIIESPQGSFMNTFFSYSSSWLEKLAKIFGNSSVALNSSEALSTFIKLFLGDLSFASSLLNYKVIFDSFWPKLSRFLWKRKRIKINNRNIAEDIERNSVFCD